MIAGSDGSWCEKRKPGALGSRGQIAVVITELQELEWRVSFGFSSGDGVLLCTEKKVLKAAVPPWTVRAVFPPPF